MYIIKILVTFLLGLLLGRLSKEPKLKKKTRECLNKKQMIENRDKLIDRQEEKIKKLQYNSLAYEQIKEIYKTEKNLINRHDKVKELIDKDN